MNSNEICIFDNCTGCSACALSCPKKCITMKSDEEGFSRPVIDDTLCVKCGKCKSVCPINIELSIKEFEPQSYAVRIKDQEIRSNSSSGGAFSALVINVLENNGAVIAAGFDENFQVVHKVCNDKGMLDELRRSKYVQSNVGMVYREAKDLLEEGRKVVFCGTPCQVAGIKSFLGKEYENLYTIDFICHGVPSPYAWQKYLDYQKETVKSDIKKVSFRSKETGWKKFSMSISFDNGTFYCEDVSKDIYLRSFIMNLNLRPSCYNCRFKTVHRLSDITLADFWGLDKVISEWDDDTGVSLVLTHSKNGVQLLNLCDNTIEMLAVPFEKAVKCNPSITCSVKKPLLRKSFMKDLSILRYDRLHEKYCGLSFSSKLRRKIAHIKESFL